MNKQNIHPLLKIIGIYRLLRELGTLPGYIMDDIIDYLDDYKCCAFCANRGSHDNCPDNVHDGLDRIEWCDYWHDAREKCDRNFFTSDFYMKFMNDLGKSGEKNHE